MDGLLELYAESIAVRRHVGFYIVALVRVLEYVAITAIRLKTHHEIRARLLTAEARQPTATFMQELVGLIESHRKYRNDKEAIRLALETFVDPALLASLAPSFLPKLQAIIPASPDHVKREAIQDLAETASSTRNMICHAKANYSRRER